MYAEKITNLKEVDFVLDNLHSNTVEELKKVFGNEYKKEIFNFVASMKKEKFIIKLKSNNEPVGIYGLVQITRNSAGIFLLTCNNLHNGNMITFLKEARKQVDVWCNNYELIMDSCYKKNQMIIKWLRLLGFQPSEYQNDDFQVYYRGDLTYCEG